MKIPVDFALVHLVNVYLEFGVFLEVDKTVTKAQRPQIPVRELCYRRNEVTSVL